MSESSGWLELESDPGLFTLLVQDFGVKGVQVEEIYDLSKPIDNQVYGFIFLFKWNERRARRRATADTLKYETDSSIVNSMFFAHQVIPNSCATHALLSILLNCNNLHLGELLENFKKNCHNLTPDLKGKAIGNEMELFRAHNSYAKAERLNTESTKSQTISSSASSSSLSMISSMNAASTREVFHFICFVPINGRLYELDGLKPYPIDHGLIEQSQHWTERFKEIISERLGANSPLNISSTSQSPFFSFSSVLQSQSRGTKQDIRFNLMSVVPDKIMLYENNLKILNANCERLRKVIGNFADFSEKIEIKKENNDVNGEECGFYRMKYEKSEKGEFSWMNKDCDLINYKIEIVKSSDVFNGETKMSDEDFSLAELSEIEKKLCDDMQSFEAKLKEEIEKRNKYKVDAQRRKHKYDEFIVTFVKMLVENGQLSELIQNQIKKTKRTNISSSVINSGGGNGHCSSSYSHLGLPKKMKKK